MFSGHYKTLEDSFRKSCSDMISKATRPETKKLVTSGNVGRYCDMVTDEVKKRSFPRDQHVLANIYRSTFEQKFSNLVHEIGEFSMLVHKQTP